MQVLQTVCGHNVSLPMVTVVRGMAKVFVGELVEAGALPMIFHACTNSAPFQHSLWGLLQLNSLHTSKETQAHFSLHIIRQRTSS